jgi:hypothetical protein
LRQTRARIDADVTLDADARGAVLAQTEKLLKVYFDAAPARPFIERYLAIADAWARRHGIANNQLLLGEFGAIKKDASHFGARAHDRARYVRDVRESAEVFDSMGLMDETDRTLDPAIIDALGLRRR